MRKSVIAVGACVALGGCALPVPIQVASWAIDVISVVATEKSVTDHGISALVQQDCAIHRAVTEDDNAICRETDDAPSTVDIASADQARRASGGTNIDGSPLSSLVVDDSVTRSIQGPEHVEDLAAFETAAGDPQSRVFVDRPENPVTVNVDMAALQPSIETEQRPFVNFAVTSRELKIVNAGVNPSAQAVLKADAQTSAGNQRPSAGLYYVIGSFRGAERAKRHMKAYRSLAPAVLKGKIGNDKREVFRVVVGPYKSTERKVAYRRIKRSGVSDSWAIRVSPKDWSVAAKVIPLVQQASVSALSARDWPGLAALATKRPDAGR